MNEDDPGATETDRERRRGNPDRVKAFTDGESGADPNADELPTASGNWSRPARHGHSSPRRPIPRRAAPTTCEFRDLRVRLGTDQSRRGRMGVGPAERKPPMAGDATTGNSEAATTSATLHD